MAECSVETSKAIPKGYPMLRLYESIAHKRDAGLNYTMEEKDMSLYRFITAGKKYHEFMVENVPGISRSTLLRHLEEHTQDIQEGKNALFVRYIL